MLDESTLKDFRIITEAEVLEAFKITPEKLEEWKSTRLFPKPIMSGDVQRYSCGAIDKWISKQKKLTRNYTNEVLLFEGDYSGEEGLEDMDADIQEHVYLSKDLPDDFKGTVTMVVTYKGPDV